jgi:hypothetical protein
VSCTICRCRLLSNSATASRDCDDDDGESEEENLRHEKKSFKEPVDIDTDRTVTDFILVLLHIDSYINTYIHTYYIHRYSVLASYVKGLSCMIEYD